MESITDFDECVKKGMQLLLEARVCAHDANADPWQFAVELALLRKAGMSKTHLRWLTSKGFAESAHEFTPAGEKTRFFRHIGQVTFGSSTCVVLTAAGIHYAESICVEVKPDRIAAEENGGNGAAMLPMVPHWIEGRRELWLGNVLLKKFKRLCPKLRLILNAFQEDGWQPRIDDPLPHSPDGKAKEHLRSAVRRLNRCQAQAAKKIEFSSDGTGEGICWEIVISRKRTRL